MTRFAIAKEISREDVYLQDVNPGFYDKVCYSIYLKRSAEWMFIYRMYILGLMTWFAIVST